MSARRVASRWAALSLALVAPTAAAGDALQPSPAETAFASLADRVHVGVPFVAGRYGVVLLWAASGPKEPLAAPGAWVGLDGAGATTSELPDPIGAAAVRVVNALEAPLYLPRGEALTPTDGVGTARIVDRPIWIAALGAAYVPVVQAGGEFARGPYSPSTDRASPGLLRGLRFGGWEPPLQERNAALSVDASRLADPLAGYMTQAFSDRSSPVFAALEAGRVALAGPPVGIALVAPDGLGSIVLEGDAARFRAQWAAIARGVALDSTALAVRNVAAPAPLVLAKSVEEIVRAIAELRETPAVRPAFGCGEQVRWPMIGAESRWVGLAVDGKPVAATFHRRSVPVAAPALPRPPQPPPPPERHDPGLGELRSRPGLTDYEERLRERREAGMGGGFPGG